MTRMPLASRQVAVEVERRRLHRRAWCRPAAHAPAPGRRSPPAPPPAGRARCAAARPARRGRPGVTRQPVTPCCTVSRGAPRSAAITGRAMACASITVRPKASGSVEACTTISASSSAAGMSSAWPTSRTRSCRPRAAMRASNSRRRPRRRRRPARPSRPGSCAIASTSTPWPFQRVSRPGSMMTGRPAGRPQAARSAASRGRAHQGRVEQPGIDAARDDADARRLGPWCSRIWPAMKLLMAITRSPRAMTELYRRLPGKFSL